MTEYLNSCLLRQEVESPHSPVMFRFRFTVGEVEVSIFNQTVKTFSILPGESKIVSADNADSLLLVVAKGLALDMLNTLYLANVYIGTVQIFGGSGSSNQCILRLGDIKSFPSYAPFRDLCFFGNPQLAFSFSSQIIADEQKPPPHSIGRMGSTDGVSFTSLDSFSTVDRRGKINHYIIQPSAVHLVVEAKASMLTVMWQPDDIKSTLVALWKLQDCFPRGQHPPPFAEEKLRLAKLSIYNSMTGVLPEKLKVSVSLEASDWKVVFPLTPTQQPNLLASHLALGFGRAQVIAGDYIETSESRQRRGLCESKNSSIPVENDTFDQRVEDLVAIHNPIVSSFVFNVACVSCAYIAQPGDSFVATIAAINQGPSCIITSPWNMKGIVSLSSLFSHPDFFDIQLQLFLGDLELVFGTQVCKQVLFSQFVNYLY
ncbi:hypothetical protein EON65_44415, partial [archaeon]